LNAVSAFRDDLLFMAQSSGVPADFTRRIRYFFMRFTLEISGLEQLRRVLGLIQKVPGVLGARWR